MGQELNSQPHSPEAQSPEHLEEPQSIYLYYVTKLSITTASYTAVIPLFFFI